MNIKFGETRGHALSSLYCQPTLKLLALTILTHLGGLCFVVETAIAQEFQVIGTLTYESLERSIKKEKHFKISVSQCSWLLETEEADINIQIGSESESVFTLLDRKTHGEIPSGKVTPGAAPVPDYTQIGLVWLAYGSRCYLQGVTNGRVRPVWKMPENLIINSNYTVLGEWKLSEQSPYLLESMTFKSDGTIYLPGKGYTRLAKPYGEGFIQALYTAQNFTNISGNLSIPRNFSLIFYRTKRNPKDASDLDVGVIWTGEVERVEKSESPASFLPKITRKTGISDMRLGKQVPNLKSVNYIRTNDWIVDTNDPKLQVLVKKVRNIKPIPKQDKRSHESQRKWVWLTLILVSLGPVTFVIYKVSAKQKTK